MKLAIVFEVPDESTYADVAAQMILRHAFAEQETISHWSFDMAMRPVAALMIPAATDAAEIARREVDQEHPWIPGGAFLMDERLKPAILAFLGLMIPDHD